MRIIIFCTKIEGKFSLYLSKALNNGSFPEEIAGRAGNLLLTAKISGGGCSNTGLLWYNQVVRGGRCHAAAF
jgi:hypothetical protein